MKKNIFLFSFCFFFSIVLYSSILRAQIYSESPITLSESGEVLTDMIYVKFKPNNVIKIPFGDITADGNSISNDYSEIKNTFVDYCTEWDLSLGDLRFSKAISQAKEEDTLYVDKITGEIKILPNLANVFIVRYPIPVDVDNIMARLRALSEVEYTHGPVQWVNCDETPNDPKYTDGSQWYLNAIQAPQAWGTTKGNPDIKIAIIDADGVEQTHEDLQSKIVGGDGLGAIGPHGTTVSGFAGAATNNGLGIASLGWNISLLTYRPTCDEQCSGVAQKIHDAVDGGVSVINLSFRTVKGGFLNCDIESQDGSTLYYYYNWNYYLVSEEIEYAIGHNVVVVASAGNNAPYIGDNAPCEEVPYPIYPAKYSGVISVSASMMNENFVEGWNWDSNSNINLDLNAPGKTDAYTGLWTTEWFNSYGPHSGTSYSAPIVSALAALIKSVNPSLTPSQIETILESSADKVGNYTYVNGWNSHFGYGRVNAYQALKYTLEHYGGTLNQTLTIPVGENWTFDPGITLKFQSGTSLVINGVLNAQGTSIEPITFTSQSGTTNSNWGSIILNGSGAAGSTIKYANIKYATEIKANNT